MQMNKIKVVSEMFLALACLFYSWFVKSLIQKLAYFNRSSLSFLSVYYLFCCWKKKKTNISNYINFEMYISKLLSSKLSFKKKIYWAVLSCRVVEVGYKFWVCRWKVIRLAILYRGRRRCWIKTTDFTCNLR